MEELYTTWDVLLSKSHGSVAIIEPFVSGQEVDINIVLDNGKLLFYEVWDNDPSKIHLYLVVSEAYRTLPFSIRRSRCRGRRLCPLPKFRGTLSTRSLCPTSQHVREITGLGIASHSDRRVQELLRRFPRRGSDIRFRGHLGRHLHNRNKSPHARNHLPQVDRVGVGS